MGTIKNRNGMDLTEAEDIKKRWQEYTEELYKKDLNDPDHSPRARHPGMQRQLDLRKHVRQLGQSRAAAGAITCGSWGNHTKLMEVMEFQLSYFKS